MSRDFDSSYDPKLVDHDRADIVSSIFDTLYQFLFSNVFPCNSNQDCSSLYLGIYPHKCQFANSIPNVYQSSSYNTKRHHRHWSDSGKSCDPRLADRVYVDIDWPIFDTLFHSRFLIHHQYNLGHSCLSFGIFCHRLKTSKLLSKDNVKHTRNITVLPFNVFLVCVTPNTTIIIGWIPTVVVIPSWLIMLMWSLFVPELAFSARTSLCYVSCIVPSRAGWKWAPNGLFMTKCLTS